MLNNKVPKRRFKGFTDDWVSKTIKEIGEVITGTTPSTKNKSFYNGEFLFENPLGCPDGPIFSYLVSNQGIKDYIEIGK